MAVPIGNRLKYDIWYTLVDGVRFKFTEACHILGAAVVTLEVGRAGKKRTFVFTGNIGRAGTPILKDLAPVSSLISNQLVLAVHPSVPAKTLQEFVELARKTKPPLFYASIGNGSQHHLAMEIFKQHVGIDLTHEEGREIARRLIAGADLVVENFTPRVIEQFGLDWSSVRALNPRTILVRMPAFGLSGPWRDRVGFAQTMEQITGLAWLTGHPHDQPRIQRGPCDPLAGTHAAFATLVALAERERTGTGHLVEWLSEVCMVIPIGVIELDEAHSSLHQAAGQQAIVSITCLARFGAIHFESLLRLLSEIDQFRSAGLHPVRHFVGRNAR